MISTEKQDEIKVYCDCCGTEHLATIRNGKLIIIDRRHGLRHMVVLPLDNTGKVVYMNK